MAKIVLRMEPYDPDAKDADGDGIVQERTPWERPVGARLLDKFGNEIQRGAVQNARPDGMQVIDANGNKIDYVPSYAGRVPSKPSAGPKSPLSDHGALSLRERGLQTIGEITAAAAQPAAPESVPEPEVSDDKRVDETIQLLQDAGIEFGDDRRALREFLGAAAEAIDRYDAQAANEEKAEALRFAARAFLWNRQASKQIERNRDDEPDLEALLASIFNVQTGGDDVPHRLLDEIYQEGGTGMLAAALINFTKGMERADLAKIAQRFQMRFADRGLEVGIDGQVGVDPEWQASALKVVFDTWDAAQAAKKADDPDSLEKMGDLLERRISDEGAEAVGAIERILQRPEARGNPRLVRESDMDGTVERFPLAEAHLHENFGDVSDVPPEAWASAMFDSQIVDENGFSVEVRDVLSSADFYGRLYGRDNYEMENDRFNFTLVKNDSGGQYGIWAVWKVVDKQTGSEYFIKTSQYGMHDAMLEKISDDVQAVLGFMQRSDTHLANPQGTEVMVSNYANGSAKVGRWVVTPHVAELQEPAVPKMGIKEFVDIDQLWDAGAINPADDMDLMKQLARIAMMDYVIDNTDRHSGNLMGYIDAGGNTRLVPIDHGLAFGGRAGPNDGDRTAWTSTEWDILGDVRGMLSPMLWEGMTINRLKNILPNRSRLRGLRGGDAAGRERERVMIEAAQEALAELDSIDLDELFSPERFQRQGIKLSSSEIAHLSAMKMMFGMRIASMKRNFDQVIDHLLPS